MDFAELEERFLENYSVNYGRVDRAGDVVTHVLDGVMRRLFGADASACVNFRLDDVEFTLRLSSDTELGLRGSLNAAGIGGSLRIAALGREVFGHLSFIDPDKVE